MTWSTMSRRTPTRSTAAAHLVLRTGRLALFAAALALVGGRARAAESTASWAIGPLEVVSQGRPKRMAEGTFVDGYTLKATATARAGAPVGDGTLVIQLTSFFPAKDLPRQPKGLHYVKGIWRLFAKGTADPGARRGGREVLHGDLTAALPADPTAGGGGFTLRTRLAPRSTPGVRAGEGALTVNDRREAELTLTLR